MGVDTIITKIITDGSKHFLNGSCGNREHQVVSADAVAQTIVFHILIDNKGNSENTLFPCFLFRDGQAVASPIADNIAEAQAQNIANPQAKVPFQHKRRGNTLISAKSKSALSFWFSLFGIKVSPLSSKM